MSFLHFHTAQLVPAGLHEVWEDGQAFKNLHEQMKALAEAKVDIEAARKVSRIFCSLHAWYGSF